MQSVTKRAGRCKPYPVYSRESRQDVKKMKYNIVYYIFLCIIITGCVECGTNVTDPTPIYHEPIYMPVDTDLDPTSDEMNQLINFLEEDTTDHTIFDNDPHKGISYFVCTGYARTLAKNASEYNITMGVVGIRDHEHIKASKYRHAMNYVIIDNQFMIIEPQDDWIYKLDEMRYTEHNGRYITIYPNAEIMTNFGKHKYTIDIDLYSDYNESQIISNFPPI